MSIAFYEKPKNGVEKTPMGFGARANALVKEKGLEQKALAEKAGMPQSTLNAILREATKSPGIVEAARIARALGVSLDDLTADGEPLPVSPLTPYDTNPAYRDLVAALEALPAGDREDVITHLLWVAERVGSVTGVDKRRRKGVSSTTPNKSRSRIQGQRIVPPPPRSIDEGVDDEGASPHRSGRR